MTSRQTVGESKGRRTQAARSEEMRERIVAAFITCIEKYGLSEASVSRITQEAGVSRGAYLHHFRAKHMIYKAAALRLVTRAFRKLSSIEGDPTNPKEDLRLILRALWDDFVIAPEGLAFVELMQAGRTDEVVAQYLRRPAFRVLRLFTWAARRRYRLKPDTPYTNADMVRMILWTLRGMSADRALVLQADFFDHQIDTIVAMYAPALDVEPSE
ncbi:MAG: TetR/AcrR family transcriptional regulator [Pseudomonadota bacterium]